jgi:porphobilinogen deaminase
MLLAELGAGCQAPVAAWVDLLETGNGKRLYGRVTDRDGAVQLTASAAIDQAAPERAGETVARLLSGEGAATLLAR